MLTDENKQWFWRWIKMGLIAWVIGAILNITVTYAVISSTQALKDARRANLPAKVNVGSQTLFRRDIPTGPDINCTTSAQCNFGECLPDGSLGTYYCECDDNYLSLDDDGDFDVNEPCNYEQKSGLVALLLSIFIGSCGIDRCYLARGNCGACCCGITKGVTLGALGIWTIIDVILIAVGSLNDGNGISLSDI